MIPWLGGNGARMRPFQSKRKLGAPRSQDRAEKRETDRSFEVDLNADRDPATSEGERDLEREVNRSKQRTSWSEQNELESVQEEDDNQGAEMEDGNIQRLAEEEGEDEEDEEEDEDQALMDAEERVYEAEAALEEAMEEFEEERDEVRDRRKGVNVVEQVEEEGDREGGEAEEEEEEGEDESRDEDEDEDKRQGLEGGQLQAKYAGVEGEEEEEYQKEDRLGQAGPSETMDDET
ncbi:hypothetical protein BGZ72_005990 [Mortierella alpina]|nr:hypothetical protein BGZ72_005990 [Mortierella alpina]